LESISVLGDGFEESGRQYVMVINSWRRNEKAKIHAHMVSFTSNCAFSYAGNQDSKIGITIGHGLNGQ
jgi:hypothetical protein